MARDTKRLDDEQQRNWRAFLGGVTAVMDRLDRDLRADHDLSLAEYEILVRLAESPDRRMRMSILAEAVAQSRSRVSHTVDRLADDGLVARQMCADDKRGIEALLTDAGVDRLRAAARTHINGVHDHLLSQLDREQFTAFGTAMEKVRAHLGGKTF